MNNLIYIFCVCGFTLLFSCNENKPYPEQATVKKEIAQKLDESAEICRTVACQATIHQQMAVSDNLYKDLHQMVFNFVDTSLTNIPMNDEQLDSTLKNFEVRYHFRVDDAIKSVNYKLFIEDSTFYIYSSFFRPDTSVTAYPEKYYKTCIKALDEHLRILEAGKPAFSHDPCTPAKP